MNTHSAEVMTVAAPPRARRVVAIDDDPGALAVLRVALQRVGGFEADLHLDPMTGLEAALEPDVSALVVDHRMPGLTGAEVVRRVRPLRPRMPILIATAYASVEGAVAALRAGASDFIQKPLDPRAVVRSLEALLGATPRERVLAIGAHPDDVEIGVGGTLLEHADDGDEVTVLTLTRGSGGGDRGNRSDEAVAAASLLSASLVLADLDDGSLDEAGVTLSIIEQAVTRVQPTIVYTHTAADRHQDHRATHRATAIAARCVPRVYAYQAPSTTVDFRPTRFTEIDLHVDGKLAAIAAHSSQAESRAYLDPELIRATARYWARFGQGTHSEPLEVVKDVPTSEGARHNHWTQTRGVEDVAA